MASLKVKDLRNMNVTQLEDKILELSKELIKFNAQAATGTNPANPGQAKQAKKTIARIKTILNQKKTNEGATPK